MNQTPKTFTFPLLDAGKAVNVREEKKKKEEKKAAGRAGNIACLFMTAIYSISIHLFSLSVAVYLCLLFSVSHAFCLFYTVLFTFLHFSGEEVIS